MAEQPRAEALVLTGPRSLEHRALALPDIGDDTALLEVDACGLCGTDHEQYTGHIRSDAPFVPGHEIVGTIAEVGSAGAERWGVAVGDRVAVEVFQSCRQCDACRAGLYRRCAAHGVATMYGFVDVGVGSGLWGGYATHLELGPDALLLPVPDDLDPVTATLFNPLGAGIRWGVTLPGTGPGDVVAVLGPGIRGLCAAAAARSAGAEHVMVTGLGEADRGRLELARRFGADTVVDVATDDPVRALEAAAGRRADVVIDVTAKAPAAFAQAVRLAATGARVVVAGTRGGGGAPGFEPDHVVYKELTIIGSLGVDFPAYQRALELLAADEFPFDELPRATVGLGGVEALLQAMAGDADAPVDRPVHGVVVPSLG